MIEKKNRRWLMPAVLGVAAVIIVAVIAFVATRPAPLPDPYQAMNTALDSVKSMPNPATLGVLGQGTQTGERFGVSGNLNLQADGNGLAVSLTDFTIGYEEGSSELEVYINRDMMAVRDPEMGENWYGVDLQEGLGDQANQVADQELIDWYFATGTLEETSAMLEELRVALSGVHDLSFSDMVDNLRSDLSQLPATTGKTEEGFTLTFDAAGQSLSRMGDDLAAFGKVLFQEGQGSENITAIILRLDQEKRLLALEITADQFLFLLDLGDPDEPSPRLEMRKGELDSLELAFTVSEGEEFTAPEYLNVFDLLNAMAGRE